VPSNDETVYLEPPEGLFGAVEVALGKSGREKIIIIIIIIIHW
jgi:hypothetical protein